MTKFENLFNDVDGILQKTRLFPKAFMLIDTKASKALRKSKGFDRTQDGGVRNDYGDGWNDATMELGNLIAEVLDKYNEEP
jgi:hypothetical protein